VRIKSDERTQIDSDFLLVLQFACRIATGSRVRAIEFECVESQFSTSFCGTRRSARFDFEFGSWKIHLKRLVHPLTGSTTWVEFDGTSVTRKVWDGRAQIEEFETDSAAGGHIEGLTLRLYNPKSHQWSLYWANSKDGTLVVPQIGEFKNGRGEFYAQDTFNGKAIFVRFIWSNTDTNMPHFEQSFSEDGGKTWEVNWITHQTRVNDGSDKAR